MDVGTICAIVAAGGGIAVGILRGCRGIWIVSAKATALNTAVESNTEATRQLAAVLTDASATLTDHEHRISALEAHIPRE